MQYIGGGVRLGYLVQYMGGGVRLGYLVQYIGGGVRFGYLVQYIGGGVRLGYLVQFTACMRGVVFLMRRGRCVVFLLKAFDDHDRRP